MAVFIPARKKFATYDNETTGLTSHKDAPLEEQPRIIEFAGLITDGVEILDTVEFICNPGVVIEEIITKITGITNAMLVEEPPFELFVDKVANFFSQADVAIAHNLSFDRALVQYDLARIGKTLADVNYPSILCCTVEQTVHQFGRRMKLSELYEHYVGPYVQKHRALDDVKLLHTICQKSGVYNAFSAA